VHKAGWALGSWWTGAGKFFPHRDSIPRPSSPQRVAIPIVVSRSTIFNCRKCFYVVYYFGLFKGTISNCHNVLSSQMMGSFVGNELEAIGIQDSEILTHVSIPAFL
jgi:hypothetical protein